jgi:hypothetical protein
MATYAAAKQPPPGDASAGDDQSWRLSDGMWRTSKKEGKEAAERLLRELKRDVEKSEQKKPKSK